MSRNIHEMSNAEIQSYLDSRKTSQIQQSVEFYISHETWQMYNTILKEKAKLVPVPPPSTSKEPQKYVFNPAGAVKEKLQLHFKDGKPSVVTYFDQAIGGFSMTADKKNDVCFSIESHQNAEFWKLLEKYPDLYVEVETTTSHVGESHHVRVYATTMIGKFDWFY